MKRFLAFLCVFTILFTSFSSLAAPGDIIHTGLKKIYRASEPSEISEDLMNDVLEVDTSKFYREIEDGKYVNVEEEERAHLDYLQSLMLSEGLKDEEAIIKYLEENATEVQKALDQHTDSISKTFDEVKASDNSLSEDDDIDDFHYSSSVPLLSGDSFSTPEPGSNVGTTKISKLTLPSGSVKWKINITDTKLETVNKDENVKEFNDYVMGRDIDVKAGNFLNIYAVDRNNTVIRFTSIKIIEDMIRQPIVYPEDLEKGVHFTGPVAGEMELTTKFSDLKFNGLDADSWYVEISSSTIPTPALDSLVSGNQYTVNADIPVKVGDRLLLTATKDGYVKAYKLFTLNESHIKPEEEVDDDEDKALVLQPHIHFSPLTKGDDVGDTKFEWLKRINLEGTIIWRYIVSDKIIPTPELDSSFKGTEFETNILNEDRNIQVLPEEEITSVDVVSKNIMLLATIADGEGYKIKGYAKLSTNENNVKMPAAGNLKEGIHYSKPIKGHTAHTTRIETLDPSGIPEFNQWRYKLTNSNPIDSGAIEFNSVFYDSRFYNQDEDIFVEEDEKYLVLAATDGYSKVKMYGVISLDKSIDNSMIRREDAAPLIPTTNYNADDPIPGSVEGSTKFSMLSFSTNIVGATQWRIATSSNSFGSIEIDSTVESAIEYTQGADIKNVSIGDYLILLATDGDGKVKGFKEFWLGERDIKGGEATKLQPGSNPGKNYVIEKGSKPGTTRFRDLKFDGVFGASEWKYKWTEENLFESNPPYLNQIVPDTDYYSIWDNIGLDIKVSWVPDEDKYGYLLLLAVDNNGKTKGYAVISVDNAVVKEHATILPDTIDIIPGETVDKVKFKELKPDTRYMYTLDTVEYPTPAVDDIPLDGTLYDGDITVRIGQHLTLFEVDDNDQIKAFKRFVISSSMIKQGSAVLNLIDNTDNPDNLVPEGSIVNGGTGIEIVLKDAKWADVDSDKNIRDRFFNGFSVDSDISQWSNVVDRLIADGGGTAINEAKDTLTFYLPKTVGYDISEDQSISLEIPPEAIDGAINPIEANGNIIIKPTITANISGDVVDNIVREKDLVDGGVEIVVTLLDGNWIGNINKDDLIDGFGDDTNTNWDKIKTEYKTNGKFTRNSSKEVTLTLPPVDTVDLGNSKEDISLVIPKELIQGASIDVVATPIFSIYPNILKVGGQAVGSSDEVSLLAPDYRIVDDSQNTWIIDIITGTLKDNINNEDVVISGLPRGLTATVTNGENNSIEINVSGTASTTLSGDNVAVKVKVKGSAVTEPNSIDSDEIQLNVVRGGSIIGTLQGVTVNVPDNKLMSTNKYMEYSLNSTNGTNGDWYDASNVTDTVVSDAGGFVAGKVYVREKANPRVFHLVATLSHPKAPTGFGIGDVNYDNSDIKIKLDLAEDDSKYEYSLDGGENWNDIISSDDITLNDTSDLRLRYKATVNSLPSLATNKIDVLDLRSVDVDVSQSLISNTTTGMEYSLNNGDTFASARTGGTEDVKFANGNIVIIRDRSNPINERKVAEIGIEDKPISASFNILEEEITATVGTDKVAQYRIGTDSWKDLIEGEKVEFKPGQVQVRTKPSKDKVASEPINVGEVILNPLPKPELKVDDFNKDISYWKDNDWVKLENANTLEYSIDDGNSWKTNNNWTADKITDIIQNTNADVSIRVKSTETTLPSQVAVVNFTGNLTWENVNLNVVEGRIEGTSADMEYSIDSTDGKNGTWIEAGADNTSVNFIQGMRVYIREKSKPLNFKELSSGISVEATLDTTNIDYNILDTSLTNTTDRVIEYRFNSNPWSILDRKDPDSNFVKYGVNFESGKLYFRARGTETTLPSLPISIDIKAKASAPSLKYDDVNYEIENIGTGGDVNYEYNVNNGAWIPGNIGTAFEGEDNVKIRIQAGKEVLPSQEQSINFTANLDLNNVVLNIGQSKLIGTSNLMEYSTSSTDGEDGTWIACDNTETSIKLLENKDVYIREKAKPRNNRKVTENPIKKKPFTDGNDFVDNRIDFNILQKTISIVNTASGDQEIVNNLQYRINNENWINVDFVKLEGATNKVLVYNVNFIPGNLEFRLRGDENTLPSDSLVKTTIQTQASAPNVSVGFDDGKYRNRVNLPVGTSYTDFEYSLGNVNGPWFDGVHLETEDLVGEVYIRTKASADKLPSLAKKLTFTPVLNLKTVVLSTHISPIELNGVTQNIQYRINNVDWKNCDPDENGNSTLLRSDGTTPLNNLNSVNIIEIRDANQTENVITIYQK